MPKLESVVVAVGLSPNPQLPKQDHEELITKFNYSGGLTSLSDVDFFNSIARHQEGYDIYGFIPGPIQYSSSRSIQKIVNFFNKHEGIGVIVSDFIERNPSYDLPVYIHPMQVNNIPFFIRGSLINQIDFKDENNFLASQIDRLRQNGNVIFHIAEPLLAAEISPY